MKNFQTKNLQKIDKVDKIRLFSFTNIDLITKIMYSDIRLIENSKR